VRSGVKRPGEANQKTATDGPSPYIAKLMGLFFNMDRLIGAGFETGEGRFRGRG
jgi:hypothetical protein